MTNTVLLVESTNFGTLLLVDKINHRIFEFTSSSISSSIFRLAVLIQQKTSHNIKPWLSDEIF